MGRAAQFLNSTVAPKLESLALSLEERRERSTWGSGLLTTPRAEREPRSAGLGTRARGYFGARDRAERAAPDTEETVVCFPKVRARPLLELDS